MNAQSDAYFTRETLRQAASNAVVSRVLEARSPEEIEEVCRKIGELFGDDLPDRLQEACEQLYMVAQAQGIESDQLEAWMEKGARRTGGDARRGVEPAGPGEYPCNSCGGAYGEDEDCAQCGAVHERADDPVPLDGDER